MIRSDESNNKVTITILETSDVHGNIFPINYGSNQPSDLGLAKVATIVKEQRIKTKNVLVIDNGDLIQGTPLAYHHARIDNKEPNPMIKVANHLKYDAGIIGNHEFNYGQEILKKAIEESAFPWLSANIVKKGTEEPYYGKPYIIKDYPEGIKVGILGLTTPYIPNWENPPHVSELDFIDVIGTAKKWVKHLREVEGVDLLIVSYHGGFERDLESGEPTEALTGENQGYQLCMEVEGIDLLLTGHQHRSIAGVKVNGVAVMQPGHQGREVGKAVIELVHDGHRWENTRVNTELIAVEGVKPDEDILTLVSSYEIKTQEWLDQPIGKIEGDMVVKDALKVRLQDNALIEFFNKVQMAYAEVEISNTALFDNQSPGLKPDVTMRDIVSNYIYPNTLKVLRIKGKDIKEALERSASYFETYTGGEIKINPHFYTPKPQHYNYDMWEGINYVINISKPHGERVTHLTYKGKPLDMEKDYDVVMNNYRAGGGGDYLMFKGKPVVKDIPTDVSELIANYILERGTIKATCNNNWKVIHD